MQILVVEDHRDTREVLSGLLRGWGYDVSAADSLKSGMDRLETEPPVDVIVSDIALPDGTGYALISEARRRGKRVLAIALSGYAYPKRRSRRQADRLRSSLIEAVQLRLPPHHPQRSRALGGCSYLKTIVIHFESWPGQTAAGAAARVAADFDAAV